LFHAIYEGQPPKKSIALVAFPKPNPAEIDEAAEREMALMQNLVTHIRELRAEAGVPPKESVNISLNASGAGAVITANEVAIKRLANIAAISINGAGAKSAWTRSTPEYDVALLYERQIDMAAERERLTKELKKLETELGNAQRNLGNESFLAKAPAHVIEGIRKRAAELKVLIEKSQSSLQALK
jgi:valyl-tRNA synthetase